MPNKPSVVGVYVAVLSSVAALLLILADWSSVPPDSTLLSTAATLLLIGLLSEAGSFRLAVGSGGSTSSIAFIPYLASIMLLGQAWAMTVAGLTVFFAETLFRQKPFVKIAHNTAKEVIAVGVSGFAYHAVGGESSLIEFDPTVLPFLIAVSVFFPLNQGTTAVAIALSTGTRLREAWGRLAGGHQLYDYATSTLALLLAYLYVQLDLFGLLIVVVPLILVRHIYQMALRLDQVNRDLLELMVKSIEARDPYTSGHSVRVSRYARVIAEELGLSSKAIDRVSTAALLHDVGKIYKEFAPVLRKRSKLEPRELRLMESHPVKGSELIRTISSLRGDVEKAVRHHHESYNGRGYPDGLAGDSIPMASRIISVVDTFDAMTTTRPYRKALSRAEAMDELRAKIGLQFDPHIVAVFCTSERVAAALDAAETAREFVHEGLPGQSVSPLPIARNRAKDWRTVKRAVR